MHVSKLSSDDDLQKELTEAEAAKMQNKEIHGTAKSRMNHFVKYLKEAAADTIGFVQRTRKILHNIYIYKN